MGNHTIDGKYGIRGTALRGIYDDDKDLANWAQMYCKYMARDCDAVMWWNSQESIRVHASMRESGIYEVIGWLEKKKRDWGTLISMAEHCTKEMLMTAQRRLNVLIENANDIINGKRRPTSNTRDEMAEDQRFVARDWCKQHIAEIEMVRAWIDGVLATKSLVPDARDERDTDACIGGSHCARCGGLTRA